MTQSEKPSSDGGTEAKDPKDKFREALERKRQKQHLHEEASQNDSKIGDVHGAVGGKRTFRRKSGG